MFLTQIIYCSKAADINEKKIESILASSRENNKKEYVTGALMFNNKYFLQCLEGARTQVNATYHRILNDQRHENVVLIGFNKIAERSFDRWSMAYIPHTKLSREAILKYSQQDTFNPYTLSYPSALCMMEELSDLYTGED